MFNIFNVSSEDFLEDLFPNQPSGNPTFSLHPELTSPEVNNDIFDSEGFNVLSEKLLDLDSTKDLYPPLHDNPLSGSTTYPLLEGFADELPPEYDDNLQFDIESDLKEIEFLLYQDKHSSLKDSIDQKNHAHLADIFVDSIPAIFTDEHTLDYSSPLIFDVYADDFLEVESDAENIYNDPFDSKGEKIKESKLLIDELDLPCDFHPPPEQLQGHESGIPVVLYPTEKYVKDLVEIHNIKQRDGETLEDFMERFKIETERMKGAPECIRIFGFMHGIYNPELIKRLNEHVPRTMEEMMIATTAFIRGEAAAANKKKGHMSWKPQDQSKKHTDKRPDFPGRKEAAAKDKPTTIYMVRSWQRTVKQKITQSFEQGKEITFPPLANSHGTEGPLVIKAEVGGHTIHRMYIDGGSSMEILYEHCLNRLQPDIKRQMVPATTSLTGFSGETTWPLGQLKLLVTIGDATHSTKAWMNFMIVKSLSPYNGIIGRPGLKAIQAVPSIVHGMLKFQNKEGIVTIRSSLLIPAECTSLDTSSVTPREKKARPANLTVPLHLNFPDQEVVVGGSLSDKGRTELYSLLKKNLDIFAWQPSDMTGVPRSVAEHRPNAREGCPPVRQKKRGQAPKRTKAIQAEVKKLVEVGIMREVYYHDWLSNPVMVKKHDGSWRMCVDFTDLNKACPQDCYPLPEIDWKVESLCGYPFKCFLDAYKGCHQIQMAAADEEKTAFHTGQGDVLLYKNAFWPQKRWCHVPATNGQGVQKSNGAKHRGISNQVLGTYIAKEDNMIKYLDIAKGLLSEFKTFSICQVPRSTLPEDEKKAWKLRLKARQYELMKGILYKRSFLTPWLRCVGPLQAEYVKREIHEGSCSMHAGPRPLSGRAGESQVPDSHNGLLHEVDRSKSGGNDYRRTSEEIRMGQYCMPFRYSRRNNPRQRENRSLGEGIKARLGEGNKNWVEELLHVLWAHRTMIKSSHDDTPFSLTYGTEAVIPAKIGMPTYRTPMIDVVNNDEELRLNLDLLEERRELAAMREARSKSKMMKYYNSRVRGVAFKPGDFVYRSNDASHAVAGGKLGPKWEGPYEVIDTLGNGAYKLRSMDGTMLPKTWNVTNLKRCYL
nr:reverse transcriptase domain-containing protein [Tanacetum cinerariifolium]